MSKYYTFAPPSAAIAEEPSSKALNSQLHKWSISGPRDLENIKKGVSLRKIQIQLNQEQRNDLMMMTCPICIKIC